MVIKGSGTGTANKLEDYEEGSWTPAFSNIYLEGAYANATGFGTVAGKYVKVGSLVTCWANIESITGASGNLVGDDNFSFTRSSLPFSPASETGSFDRSSGVLTVYNAVGTGINASGVIIPLKNQSNVVAQVTALANTPHSTNSRILLHLSYKTDS